MSYGPLGQNAGMPLVVAGSFTVGGHQRATPPHRCRTRGLQIAPMLVCSKKVGWDGVSVLGSRNATQVHSLFLALDCNKVNGRLKDVGSNKLQVPTCVPTYLKKVGTLGTEHLASREWGEVTRTKIN